MYAIRFRKTLAFPHGVRAGRRVAPVRGGRDVAAGAVNAADFLEAYSQLGQDQAQPRMGEHK